MSLQGSSLQDKNVRLRFFVYIFMGIAALGSVLYWKTQLFVAAEYQEAVPYNNLKTKQSTSDRIKSKNFEIETFDASPTVQNN